MAELGDPPSVPNPVHDPAGLPSSSLDTIDRVRASTVSARIDRLRADTFSSLMRVRAYTDRFSEVGNLATGRKMQLGIITLTMSLVDVEDRVHLTTILAAGFSVLTIEPLTP